MSMKTFADAAKDVAAMEDVEHESRDIAALFIYDLGTRPEAVYQVPWVTCHNGRVALEWESKSSHVTFVFMSSGIVHARDSHDEDGEVIRTEYNYSEGIGHNLLNMIPIHDRFGTVQPMIRPVRVPIIIRPLPSMETFTK